MSIRYDHAVFSRVLGAVVRDVERLLIAANIVGSLVAGWQHQPAWLPVPVACFAAYVILQDRALRRQIGFGHWPSAGFARFSLGTNLYFALKNVVLSGLLFVIAGAVARATGL